MTQVEPAPPASYELPISSGAPVPRDAVDVRPGRSLPESFLARNVLWFCQLRWVAIAILLAFGVLGRVDELTRFVGLFPPGLWPFGVAGLLTLSNVAYLSHARFSRSSGKSNASLINLYFQIVLDLLVLTAVVHFLGSVRTYIPFAYLFHIVLACVFFSRRISLTVMLIASALFGACVAAETVGVLQPLRIFTDAQMTAHGAARPAMYAWSLASAVGIWLAVWYLASHLSEMVRARDTKLAETNRRLVAAQDERSRHMLIMTHQLKAPFAAIHANVQLLLKGHCGALSDDALEVSRRIAARSRRLAKEIQEMLQLANLSSSGQDPPQSVPLDLSGTLQWCVEQVQPLAQERGITLDVDVQPARTEGVEDHLKMLFGNLLSNAVSYSRKDNRVHVRCRCEHPSGAVVTVRDEGIGIPAEKLPRIFEEHYRTKEAVLHNKESSGLGLAIVRHVTELHGIRLRVQSQPGTGTTFELWFPHATPGLRASGTKENRNGLPDDCG